jgi:FkbM family methyltransferase
MNRKIRSYLGTVLPRTIRQHSILFGALRGCRIVTSWHDYPAAILGRTERLLLDWFADSIQKGETWLDVGAHYGYTAIAISRLVGKEGRAIAFEPMVSTAGCLNQTKILNNFSQLTILPLALGKPLTLELQQLPFVRGMVDSTLGAREGFQETIMVARFDWLWPQICGGQEDVHGVKIDVQGMEIEVLEGMSGMLKKFGPKLVVEMHKGVHRGELLNLVASLGYSLPATPIEPTRGEVDPLYLDDRSYAFRVI